MYKNVVIQVRVKRNIRKSFAMILDYFKRYANKNTFGDVLEQILKEWVVLRMSKIEYELRLFGEKKEKEEELESLKDILEECNV